MTLLCAHSLPDRPESDWEPLAPHLKRVAALARRHCAAFGAPSWGAAAGLLHDLGKSSADFQKRLRGTGPRCDHSTAGAIAALRLDPQLGPLLAYAVAGHHAGLPNGGAATDADLGHRLKQEGLLGAATFWRDDPARAAKVQESLRTEFAAAMAQGGTPNGLFAATFFIRMVYSALVDADFLATEWVLARKKGAARRVKAPTPTVMAQALRAYLDGKFGAEPPTHPVALRRAEILAACRDKAASPPGVFSLSVPTGAGKTLSSLSFALEHAARHGLRRVIYAIPFTSIIEQTADVFRKALAACGDGAVLEHHSAALDAPEGADATREQWLGPERLRLATENWDAPLVTTTTVQLFESLFANRSSRCRKLHNLARSVIVLDEVQALPVERSAACLAALRELTLRYGATVVLCSATVPKLAPPKMMETHLPPATEIAPLTAEQRAAFRRVTSVREGDLSDAALIERLSAAHQVLCVVDARRHAAELFQALPKDGARFHLSAAMCPAHRRAVLAAVKQRLADGAPCRLISTRVIEAGVDVSFPEVWRAMAGVDSLAQAAGRCNREGRDETLGRFHIFTPERADALPKPLADLRKRRQDAETVLSQESVDPLAPETVQAFFTRYFGTAQFDADKCWARLNQAPSAADIPFAAVAGDFHMIDDAAQSLLVPYGEAGAALIAELTDALALLKAQAIPRLERNLLRRLQAYSVGVYGLAQMIKARSVLALDPEGRFHTIAHGCDTLYDPDVGVSPERVGLMDVAATIM